MRPELVAIGVKLKLLSINRVVQLSLILSVFVLDVELIGGSALVVKISCLSCEV